MLIPILRAARCRSTHHFFAIDALERLGDPLSVGRPGRLRDLLLKHHGSYLKGAKDPDDEFKDFQNHVLHVSDGGWGGAVKACQHWLEQSLGCLRAGQWSDAAYACGVLSHYFTDPIMPLHTGQTERESVVHRPMEWSICKSYEEIYSQCQFAKAKTRITLGDHAEWIGDAVEQAAGIAHQHYHRLIEIYNLQRSLVDPRQGLGKEARQILSELFDVALNGWAAVLTRMASMTDRELPDSSLTMATLIAGLDMPRAWVVRKFTDAGERAAVERIFDEYTSTGELRDHLPLEIKVVRKELAKSRQSQGDPPQTVLHTPVASKATASDNSQVVDRPPAVARPPVVDRPVVVDRPRSDDRPPSPPQPKIVRSGPKVTFRAPQRDVQPARLREPPVRAQVENDSADPKLSEDSRLVDAPSIGPKTAARFTEIGIHTVGEFLAADCNQMANQLQTQWIKPELLADWQAQAALVCDVQALCGYKAQLLVAVGCRSTEELAAAESSRLQSAIAKFCRTKEAQRILRSAAIPDIAEVQRWIDSAR